MTDDRKSKMPADWDETVDGEWDDEYASAEALAEGEDLELLVEYLNKHLDPERMEQVRKRLEEDDAFREFAAPLVLMWSIPPYHVRHPRPAGEMERGWEEFVRRSGFPNHPHKPHWRQHPMWRRIRFPLLALLIFALAPYVYLGVSAVVSRTPLREWYITRRDFAVVPHQEGWIPLGDSIFVELTPDATLRSARELVRGIRHAHLDGTARFRGIALDSLAGEPRTTGLMLHTRGGIVAAGEGEYTVTARGDTTLVEVHRPSKRSFFYFVPLPTAVVLKSDTNASPFVLRELERGRLVRDRPPERLPALPTTPSLPARP